MSGTGIVLKISSYNEAAHAVYDETDVFGGGERVNYVAEVVGAFCERAAVAGVVERDCRDRFILQGLYDGGHGF